MATKTTIAKYDTCQCVIEYTWDDTLSETNRVHTLSNVFNKCPAHSLTSDNNLFSLLLEENKRKNDALQIALDNGPSTLYDIKNSLRLIKETVVFSFIWSGTAPNRVLTISFSVSLTNTQKTTIRNALNSRFGTGRVTLL